MPSLRLAILFGLCLVLPQGVFANIGVVRGGEHTGFTRLTISTERDISSLEQRQTGSDTYRLVVTPGLVDLDSSKAFDRLNSNRVKAVRTKGTEVELVLNCDCEARVSLGNQRLVIVDIANRQKVQGPQLPVLPKATGAFPNLAHDGAIDASLFALDFSVVDRVNRMIASQIGQTASVSGFSDLAAPTPWGRLGAEQWHLAEKSTEPSQDRCIWSDAIWAMSDRPPYQSDEQELEDVAVFDPGIAEIGDALVVRFLSEGLLEEAQAAFSINNPSEYERKQLFSFLALLDGSAEITRMRFGDCNPLDDILIAANGQKSDMPNDVKLKLLNSFSALPLGLQLVLFPQLTWLAEESSEALFPGLSQHLVAEMALAERKPLAEDGADFVNDPDSLAAVSIELRDTHQEKQSWEASFAAYLTHRRYFDAAAQLLDEPPLSDAEQRIAVSQLIDHLVLHGDSITLVEIALSAIPDFDPAPTQAALARMIARLEIEGFTDEAYFVAQGFPGELMQLAPPDVDALKKDESTLADRRSLDRSLPTVTSAPQALVADVWTVSRAQQSVEAAQELRQALAEKLSR